MEAFSIASAVVSVILGAYAIWLSVVFYRMSDQSAKQIQESSKDLSSSVSKLEKLFEHLYSDTFSMMRDTYSDMRRHVWPETATQEPAIADKIEARADSKIDAIRKELLSQVEVIATQVGGTDTKVEQIREELLPLVETAIERSRSAEAEAREETLREFLINRIRSAGGNGINAGSLYYEVGKKNVGWQSGFFDEIPKLRDDNIIKYEGKLGSMPTPEETIYPTTGASQRRNRRKTS
jgi:hypothetical protein